MVLTVNQVYKCAETCPVCVASLLLLLSLLSSFVHFPGAEGAVDIGIIIKVTWCVDIRNLTRLFIMPHTFSKPKHCIHDSLHTITTTTATVMTPAAPATTTIIMTPAATTAMVTTAFIVVG